MYQLKNRKNYFYISVAIAFTVIIKSTLLNTSRLKYYYYFFYGLNFANIVVNDFEHNFKRIQR